MGLSFGLLVIVSLCAIPFAGCSDTQPASACVAAEDCDDDNECTADACDSTNGTCSNTPLDDGALCEAGECQSGACEPISSTFPCTEEGIRDAIDAGGGPHAFECGGPTTVLTQAEIVIDKSVILDGLGDLIVDGNQSHRVFSVAPNVTAGLRRLAVEGGVAPMGGGILNLGTAMLVESRVAENRAGSEGGGIANGAFMGGEGEMVIVASVISDNQVEQTVPALGGGISSRGTLTISDSTVSENRALVGGGISNLSGPMKVKNSTISGNSGGGVNNEGIATLLNTTVSGNTGGPGGGVGNTGSLTLASTTVSDNSSTFFGGVNGIGNYEEIQDDAVLTVMNSLVDGDCHGRLISNGHNVESPDNTCGFDAATDRVDVSAEELNLGPLAENGGPTRTHALQQDPLSVAIDAIPGAACVDADGEPITSD